MAKPSAKELKNAKEFAEKLLEIEGVDHDEWLLNKYIEVQSESRDILEKALDLYLEKSKVEEKEENKSFFGTLNKSEN